MDSPREPGAGFGGANGFGFAGRGPGAAFSRVTRAYSAWRTAPTWAQRALATIVLLVVVGLAAVLLVVGLTVGAVIAVAVGAVLLVRSAWARLTGGRAEPEQSESGLDTMRSNVRVIRRETTAQDAGPI
jgi:hypothetical protein